MTTAVLRRRADPIHGTFLAACRATWVSAPLVVGVSVVWALSALPVAAAVVGAVPVPWVVLTLPWLLATTGAHRVWAGPAVGDAMAWRAIRRLDPVLALVTWCFGLAIEWLACAGDAGVVAGCVVGAVGALVLPLAFAYGAVRDRHGIAAVSGGLVLATLRPDLAVTLLAMIVIAGFAMLISAGSLILCVPALVAVFSCLAVAAELRRIDVAVPGTARQRHHST